MASLSRRPRVWLPVRVRRKHQLRLRRTGAHGAPLELRRSTGTVKFPPTSDFFFFSILRATGGEPRPHIKFLAARATRACVFPRGGGGLFDRPDDPVDPGEAGRETKPYSRRSNEKRAIEPSGKLFITRTSPAPALVRRNCVSRGVVTSVGVGRAFRPSGRARGRRRAPRRGVFSNVASRGVGVESVVESVVACIEYIIN